MGLFDKLESKLEQGVNGAFARAFKSEVQPVEIASGIRRAMDDRASSVKKDQRPIVPNLFTVELSPTDYVRLSGWGEDLDDELIASAQEHADEQRYRPGGPLTIVLQEDEHLETGVFRLRPATAKAADALAHQRANPRPTGHSRDGDAQDWIDDDRHDARDSRDAGDDDDFHHGSQGAVASGASSVGGSSSGRGPAQPGAISEGLGSRVKSYLFGGYAPQQTHHHDDAAHPHGAPDAYDVADDRHDEYGRDAYEDGPTHRADHQHGTYDEAYEDEDMYRDADAGYVEYDDIRDAHDDDAHLDAHGFDDAHEDGRSLGARNSAPGAPSAPPAGAAGARPRFALPADPAEPSPQPSAHAVGPSAPPQGHEQHDPYAGFDNNKNAGNWHDDDDDYADATGYTPEAQDDATSAYQQRQAAQPPQRRPVSPRERPWLKIDGQRYPLLGAITVLGRDDDVDIVIDDPGVSRRHGEVRITHDGPHLVMSLRDLGSTNGTFVNGERIDSMHVHDGDRLTLGRTPMTIHLGDRP